jgi:hypothetical protein
MWRLIPKLAVPAVVLLLVLLGWPMVRSALHLDGARARRFEDTTGLIRLAFTEPGWSYLDLGRKTLQTHFDRTPAFLESVRGTFLLRDGKDGPPLAVVCFRIDPGALGLEIQRATDQDREKWAHQRARGGVEALGGRYTPLTPGAGGGEDKEGEVRLPLLLGRLGPLRVEGTAVVPGEFFVWQDAGPYRLVTLVALEYNRTYYVHLVFPEGSEPSLAPVLRVLRDAEFTRKLG